MPLKRLKQTLVVGLGNTIRGDDAIGIQVVRALRERYAHLAEEVDFKEIEEAQVNLLEFLAAYERIIIVDAISTAHSRPGEVHRITPDMLQRHDMPYSSHQMGLMRMIEMARTMRMSVPKEIIVFAVEIENKDEFACEMSVGIEAALPKVVRLVKEELRLPN
jgi:hydrogenase maturation protease